jgi:hypothetical protein
MPMPYDAGRVELEELHVLERHAAAVGQRHAVAGQRVGVRGDLEHAPEAAGGEQHGAAAEDVQLAVGDAVARPRRAPPPSTSRSTTWYSSKNSTPCLMHCW